MNNVTGGTIGASMSSKIERYGWTMKDEPGQFMMIPKHDLMVDERYQRDVKEKEGKVLRIASAWSWLACGTLLVAMRPAGFYIVDGQHRWRGALRRSDISDLPCLVFEADDVVQEANAFISANTNRKPMTAMQRIKAQVVAGDGVAEEAHALIAASGRVMRSGTDKHSVSCVGAIMKALREDAPAFRRVWPVVVALCEDRSIVNDIVKTLAYLEAHLAEGQSLAAQPWRKRLIGVGYDGVIDAMRQARAYHKKGGERTDALGVVKAVNAKMRTSLLEME